MVKYLREYRFYIVLFAFVLIPVVAIDTSTRAPRDYLFYDKVIVTVTSPIQGTISWMLDLLANGFNDYIYLWHARRDNLALTEENRNLLNTIAGLRETRQENVRLHKLLAFEDRYQFQGIVARIIAKDVSTEFRAIRINRGESSGVRRNMAVVTSEGIVGRVLRTTAHTADVITVTDLMSAVDVVNERSRARGIMEGLTDDVAQLRFTVRTDDFQPGDNLISSGLGGIFPKGLSAGTVVKVRKKQFGITQQVEVRPSVDFSKLEEMIVITHSESDEGDAPASPRSSQEHAR